MPARIRITLLFASIVFFILGLVCGSIYYFSFINRQKSSKARLTDFAITTGSLLSQSKTFDDNLIHKIDTSTKLSLTNKSVEVFNYLNQKIYSYADNPDDSSPVTQSILDDAKIKGNSYFTLNEREAIAYHFVNENLRAVIIVAALDKNGNATLRQLALILWLSFFCGILIALATGYWFFSRILLTPIRKMADEVREISAQNLARRIQSADASDEWNYLSNTLNELMNRLQESFEMQRRFISNASHELSTPLSSISSQLEVSLQRDRNADEYRRVMQSVYQDVLQLNKLTQTLLEFAKASGSVAGLEINLVRMDEVLLSLKSEIIKLDKKYSMVLDFENLPEQEERLLVSGNELLLLMALKNIVVNACKYSKNNLARVQLHVEPNKIAIEISDDGKGIEESELKNIFQPFYRSDDDSAVKGFGLGLSLANRIIKLHKGYINVASTINKGSSFIVYLPIADK
jgi:two-component system sensor histidine kinase ArlS